MHQYAVWGNPIHQSKSPTIHHLFAQQTGKQLKYTAQLGDETIFEEQLRQFFLLGAKGCNITAPFKERAFILADLYSERCQLAQACNTLKRLDDGRLYADNTDGAGLVLDLERLGWLRPKQEILILGAGGATKGVLYSLLQAQQSITIYNRTTEKAVDLAQQFAKFGEIKVTSWATLAEEKFDLIINATSLGLQGKCIELPPSLFTKTTKVYDMQYAINQQTPFLNYAKSYGAEMSEDGLGMLVGQAAYAFECWEGVLPDMTLVLRLLKKEMQS